MMDEIFHSTNATDGIAASTVFLKHLYERPDTISIISTHYKELANVFGDQKGSAESYQMVAQMGENGVLTYTYTLAPGISDTSSVMEILAERGLLNPPSAAVNTPN
jgi:DNA mismatch repair ATPase MutS